MNANRDVSQKSITIGGVGIVILTDETFARGYRFSTGTAPDVDAHPVPFRTREASAGLADAWHDLRVYPSA